MHMTSAFLIACNLFPRAAFDPVLPSAELARLAFAAALPSFSCGSPINIALALTKKAVAHMFNLTVNLQPTDQLSADRIESLASCGIGPLGRERDSRPAHIARRFERAGCI